MFMLLQDPRSKRFFSSYANTAGFVIAIVFLLTLFAWPGFLRGSGASSPTFTTFDVPAAGTGADQGTAAVSINDAGQIAGTYVTGTLVVHGFIRSAAGAFTTFDAANAGAGSGQGTLPAGINSEGDVSGTYFDSGLASHGFVRVAATATITEFDAPNAPTSTIHRGTSAIGIDDSGDVTGFYVDAGGTRHGFVRAANGTFTDFDVTGAGTQSQQGTIPIRINSGTVVGTYVDSNGIYHGFIRASNGTITAPLDAFTPGSSNPNHDTFPYGTLAGGIDNAGDVGGVYVDSAGVFHGFVCLAPCTGSSKISTFSVPAAGTTGPVGLAGTLATTVNALGGSGTYSDSSGIFHVFTVSTSGVFTAPIDDPNASTTAMLPGTISLSMNDEGVIAGFYLDSNSVGHGFVRSPGTTTTISSVSPNPAVYGQTVTIAAAVASTSGATPPNGESVTFAQGSTTLGTGTLTGGSATFATSALTAGTYSISASYAGDSNFGASSSAATSLTVTQATPVITWATPSPISSGTALSGTQLDATANVAGTFAYTPPSGTVLSAGQHTLSVTFTPTDATDYKTATASVSLTVNSATQSAPVITSLSPATANAGATAFTLTVNGSNFVSGATVSWGSSALTTTFVSASQVTASVTASNITSSGTVSVTVTNPQSAGGGVSNTFSFVVNSAPGSSGSFTVNSTATTLTVTHGQNTTLPVTFTGVGSGATVTVSCVNLPTGASCSYANNVVTVSTSATTPPGSYPIIVIFTVTQQVTAMNQGAKLYFATLLPLGALLMGLLWMSDGNRVSRMGLMLVLIALVLLPIAGCSNNSYNSGGSNPQQVTTQSSLPITLTVN